MAWIDFSSTESNDWTEGPSDIVSTGWMADPTYYGDFAGINSGLGASSPTSTYAFKPVPGQENANLTAVLPIQGDLVPAGGGGGGSTRPASGFLYPRGQG